VSRSSFRLVPPAGAPVPVRAVLPALVERPGTARGLAALQSELGVPAMFLVSSGRAALTILLEALRQRSHRLEVVIPAYTCFSVPSAIARAGLTIRLCDVDPDTLDLDPESLRRLPLDRALGIVPSGLYGLPADLAGLEATARLHGASLVDDAAQCLGATVAARPCGTFGDVGFFSLGRGKGVTTMGGGILVTHRADLARDIEALVQRLPTASVVDAGAAIAGSLLYSGLLRPSMYWLVDRMPFLGLGGSHFDPAFDPGHLSVYQRRLAERLLPLAAAYNKIRRDHADHLRAGLEGVAGITMPRPVAGASPVYLRFPILTRDATHRASLLERLRATGISGSASYPTAIGDIPGIAPYLAPDQERCPAAGSIATRILTLPTHPSVTSRDVERMIATVRSSG
jgi:perosamine synthetase